MSTTQYRLKHSILLVHCNNDSQCLAAPNPLSTTCLQVCNKFKTSGCQQLCSLLLMFPFNIPYPSACLHFRLPRTILLCSSLPEPPLGWRGLDTILCRLLRGCIIITNHSAGAGVKALPCVHPRYQSLNPRSPNPIQRACYDAGQDASAKFCTHSSHCVERDLEAH